MKILNRKIGIKHKPFIIAEISANHNGSLEKALKIVDQAAICGVSAIKIQSIDPNKITLNSRKKNFIINNKKSIWYKQSYYDIYKKASLSISWQKKILKRALQKGIIGFSTPFDEESVEFLEKINVPCYKIASFENNHFPLLKKIAKTKKPVIMSLGMLTLKEIEESYEFLKINGTKSVALLKCTSVYPSEAEELNLKTIQDLKKRFDCEIGFSDHTNNIYSSICAVSLGATIIEKHFNLSNNTSSLDEKFSIKKNEMGDLVSGCNLAHASIGKINYSLTNREKISRKSKRSIFASKDIKKDQIFDEKNLIIARPNIGLPPKEYYKILGRKAKKNISFATSIKKKMYL
jgi:pseudaminic acid synthase